jgi:hypothetical protein
MRHIRFGLAELAVLAAAAVDEGGGWLGVPIGLAFDASPNAGDRTAAAFGDRLATFHAVHLTLTYGHAGAGGVYGICDGIVDLVLNRAVWRPAGGHFSCPS